jgi:hypothetical protein
MQPYGKCPPLWQVPIDIGTGIRLANIDFSIVARLARAQLRQECPEQSDAEINETIFSAILDLMGDPAWEGVQ